MILPFTLTIPANTFEPIELDSYVFDQDGYLTRIFIDIPAGWAYTSGIQFVFSDGDVIPHPTKSEKFITGDDSNYDFHLVKRIQKGDKMSIYGVNFDENAISHTCVVMVEFMTERELEGRR